MVVIKGGIGLGKWESDGHWKYESAPVRRED